MSDEWTRGPKLTLAFAGATPTTSAISFDDGLLPYDPACPLPRIGFPGPDGIEWRFNYDPHRTRPAAGTFRIYGAKG